MGAHKIRNFVAVAQRHTVAWPKFRAVVNRGCSTPTARAEDTIRLTRGIGVASSIPSGRVIQTPPLDIPYVKCPSRGAPFPYFRDRESGL
jgi:hypothetical protein